MADLGETRRGGPVAAPPPWREIAASAEFRRLEAVRRRAMVMTLTIFSVVFGAFLVLSAYARPFMRKSVSGGLTVAYVWVLALTVLTWALVWYYLRFSERLERMGQELVGRGGWAQETR